MLPLQIGRRVDGEEGEVGGDVKEDLIYRRFWYFILEFYPAEKLGSFPKKNVSDWLRKMKEGTWSVWS